MSLRDRDRLLHPLPLPLLPGYRTLLLRVWQASCGSAVCLLSRRRRTAADRLSTQTKTSPNAVPGSSSYCRAARLGEGSTTARVGRQTAAGDRGQTVVGDKGPGRNGEVVIRDDKFAHAVLPWVCKKEPQLVPLTLYVYPTSYIYILYIIYSSFRLFPVGCHERVILSRGSKRFLFPPSTAASNWRTLLGKS